MEIKSIQINSPKFGARRLFSASLQNEGANGTTKSVRGFISELTSKDVPLIRELIKKLKKSDVAKSICTDFLQAFEVQKSAGKKSFYMVECPGVKSATGKVKGLLEVEDGEVFIKKMQTIKDASKDGKIKGIGTCLLYIASKIAQSKDRLFMEVIAPKKTHGFFSQFGAFLLFDSKKGLLAISRNAYNSFQRNIASKYNIKNII